MPGERDRRVDRGGEPAALAVEDTARHGVGVAFQLGFGLLGEGLQDRSALRVHVVERGDGPRSQGEEGVVGDELRGERRVGAAVQGGDRVDAHHRVGGAAVPVATGADVLVVAVDVGQGPAGPVRGAGTTAPVERRPGQGRQGGRSGAVASERVRHPARGQQVPDGVAVNVAVQPVGRCVEEGRTGGRGQGVGGQDQHGGLRQRAGLVQDGGRGSVQPGRPVVGEDRPDDVVQLTLGLGEQSFVTGQRPGPVQGPGGECLHGGGADVADRVGCAGDVEQLAEARQVRVRELPQGAEESAREVGFVRGGEGQEGQGGVPQGAVGGDHVGGVAAEDGRDAGPFVQDVIPDERAERRRTGHRVPLDPERVGRAPAPKFRYSKKFEVWGA